MSAECTCGAGQDGIHAKWCDVWLDLDDVGFEGGLERLLLDLDGVDGDDEVRVELILRATLKEVEERYDELAERGFPWTKEEAVMLLRVQLAHCRTASEFRSQIRAARRHVAETGEVPS